MILAALWPVLVNWYGAWNDKEGYYSHGFLVPPIAAFMLWTIRGKLTRTELRPSWVGLVLLIVSLPVYAVGLMMGLGAIYFLAFFLFVFGAMLALFGKQFTKTAAMPIIFLVTMIPLAAPVVDKLTFPAQLVSTTVATKLLQLVFWGTDVSQQGNQIVSSGIPGGVLVIATPCSGLRLLISLITFTWFFVYVLRTAAWKKAVLLISSLPLAVFINSLRIAMIGCVGYWTESSDAMHKFHDYSGYIGLVVCFVILFGIAKLIRANEFYSDGPYEATESIRKQWATPIGAGAKGTLVIVALVVGIVMSFTAKPLYNLPKGHLDRSAYPKTIGTWTSQEIPIDKISLEMLNKGDLCSRIYSDVGDTGRQIYVLMDAALDMSAFHDPHLCLPGSGQPIGKENYITISIDKPRPMKIRATMLEATGDAGQSLFIYFYMLKDKSFPRTYDAYAESRHNKRQDLKSLLKKPWNTADLRQDIRSRQFVWYRFSTDMVNEQTDRQFLISFIKKFVANAKSFGE